ncbi:MAG: nucleotide exchange factor GrpE [Deltaproteobacteria bacterium]|nr:nucleotide exchange factor GrpE [Deltaproteobacteria bacterium]
MVLVQKEEIILKNKNRNQQEIHEKKKSGENTVEIRIEESGEEKSPLVDEKVKTPDQEKREPTMEDIIQAQLAEKTKEATENLDKWLRLRAEFENFKKRMQKEKSDLMKFSNESLLTAMLPALDNLARAVNHGKQAEENASLLEGVEIIHNQFLSILERFGVKVIQAVGEIFDPAMHEAIAQEESNQEPNRVLAEVERGYRFHDRLLRPAKVIVSKPKAGKIEGA